MNKKKDTVYGDAYEQYEGCGFEFSYKNKRLGVAKNIFRKDIAKIEPTKRNHDETPLFVNCASCGIYMEFEPGLNDDMDGRWICPSCGTVVRERTIYSQLERENEEFNYRMAALDDNDPEWL